MKKDEARFRRMQLQKDQQDMGWTYLMVGKADKKAFFVPN